MHQDSYSCSFVKFDSSAAAKAAIDQMSGYKIENKTLQCKLANVVKYNNPSHNIYIKPLLPFVTEGIPKRRIMNWRNNTNYGISYAPASILSLWRN